MQRGPLHLRIARNAVPTLRNRIALPRKKGYKSNVSKWTVEISGMTLFHIVPITLLVLGITSAAGSLFALILVGLQLCPTSLATELFHECAIGGLSSGLISVLLDHRSRK